MNDIPKVFTVLDEINEIHLELKHATRQLNLKASEERVGRLFEIAKQQALHIHMLEERLDREADAAAAKLKALHPAYLVHSDTFPPGHLLLNEEALLKALDEPAFDDFHSDLLKVRIRDLFKKAK